MVLITSLSLFSFKGVSTSGINIPHLDKLVHFTFYFFATILGGLSYKEIYKKEQSLLSAGKIMLLFSIVYGMVIEIIQYSFTENREGDFLDFLANSLGAFLGFLVIKHLLSKRVF